MGWQESLAGTAATEGDVTWKYSVYPEAEWENEGGDVVTNIMTSVESKGWVGRSPVLFFPMTEKFKDVVTGWIDGSVPNYGVLVKRDTEDPRDPRLRPQRVLLMLVLMYWWGRLFSTLPYF